MSQVFSGMLSLVYLAEITYYDGTEKTLYVGTHGYTTQPTDTPANIFFEPWIESPMLFAQNAWTADGVTSRSGSGELRLINTEGQLNFMADCAIDGRAFRMMCAYENDTYATFRTNTILAGTMAVPQWEDDLLIIQLRDKQAIIDQPIQSAIYLGNNILPNGIEGGADLESKRKPLLFGRVFNISPIPVNTSLLIYQVSSAAIDDVTDVYAGGASLSKGANYTSQADMETNAPDPAFYRVWPAGGCFRLGSDPVKTVTCHAREGATETLRRPGSLLQRAALAGGLTASDLNTADLAALDTDAPYECGIWINGDDTTASVIDFLAGGCGAWWTFDAVGKLRTQQLKNPSASGNPAVTTLTAIEILADQGIERVSIGDGPDGLPPKEIKIHYQKNHTLQTSDLFGVVNTDRRQWLETEWRTLSLTSATIAEKHLLAGTLERYTPIAVRTDANTEANRTRTLRCTRRDTLRLTCQVSPNIQTFLVVGAIIEIEYPRYGYDAGRKMVILGIERDARIGLFTLTLWG
jgi:hypothetical protein